MTHNPVQAAYNNLTTTQQDLEHEVRRSRVPERRHPMTVDQVVAQLRDVHDEMMRRNRILAAAGLRETTDEPPVVAVATNSRDLFAARPDALQLAEGIARMGRKANVWLVLTGPQDDQEPTMADLGSALLREYVAAGAVEFRLAGAETSR